MTTAQHGQLLYQGQLKIGDNITKLKDRQVFLFEQVIVLSEIITPKTQHSSPVYVYNSSLQVVELFWIMCVVLFIYSFKKVFNFIKLSVNTINCESTWIPVLPDIIVTLFIEMDWNSWGNLGVFVREKCI